MQYETELAVVSSLLLLTYLRRRVAHTLYLLHYSLMDLSTSCRVFLAVNFAYSKGENELEGGKTVFPPPTLVFPSASCFSSSKTLHSVDKAYILLHILQNMCKILVRMNNLSDFPGIFHFNSIFSSFFWFKLEMWPHSWGKLRFPHSCGHVSSFHQKNGKTSNFNRKSWKINFDCYSTS